MKSTDKYKIIKIRVTQQSTIPPPRVSRLSLPCTSTTAVAFGLRRPQTTCISASYSGFLKKSILIVSHHRCFSGSCSARWTTSTTTHSTGQCWSRKQQRVQLSEEPSPLSHLLLCLALAEEDKVVTIIVIIITLIIIIIIITIIIIIIVSIILIFCDTDCVFFLYRTTGKCSLSRDREVIWTLPSDLIVNWDMLSMLSMYYCRHCNQIYKGYPLECQAFKTKSLKTKTKKHTFSHHLHKFIQDIVIKSFTIISRLILFFYRQRRFTSRNNRHKIKRSL